MTRPNTPSVKTATGTRITAKRCCNGCGRTRDGDANDADLHAAVNGQELPDVRDECGCTTTAHHQDDARWGAPVTQQPTPSP